MKSGVALLPSSTDIVRIVEVQNRLCNVYDLEPRLSTHDNLPHITLLQGESDGPLLNDHEAELVAARVRDAFGELTVQLAQIIYVERGWYFLNIAMKPALQKLHEEVFSICRNRLKVSEDDLRKDLTGYTAKQAWNFRQYGYRYIGEEYAPHITLGRTFRLKRDYSPDEIEAKFFGDFEKRVVQISSISVHTLGKNGSHEQIIFCAKL